MMQLFKDQKNPLSKNNLIPNIPIQDLLKKYDGHTWFDDFEYKNIILSNSENQNEE